MVRSTPKLGLQPLVAVLALALLVLGLVIPGSVSAANRVSLQSVSPASGRLNGLAQHVPLTAGNSVSAQVRYTLDSGQGEVRVLTHAAPGNTVHAALWEGAKVGPGTGTATARFAILCDGSAEQVRITQVKAVLYQLDANGQPAQILAEELRSVNLTFACSGESYRDLVGYDPVCPGCPGKEPIPPPPPPPPPPPITSPGEPSPPPEPTPPTDPKPPGQRFPDLPPSHPAYSAVMDLVEAGTIDGYPDGTFQPERSITRAEFAKLQVLTAGHSPNPNGPLSLTDVANHWAAQGGFLQTAVAIGAIAGFPDRTFQPDLVLTRAQGIRIVAGTASKLGATAEPGAARRAYTDIPTDAWYEEWLDIGLKTPLIGPHAPFPVFTAQQINGDAGMTRADAAMLLANFNAWRAAISN